MALLYVDENDASLNWSQVTSGETLEEGEFVVDDGDKTIRRFDPSSDPLPHGIIVHHPGSTSDALTADDETYVNYGNLWQYDGSEGDYAYWQPLDQVDQIKPLSQDDADDGNGNTPTEPSFSEGDVIGVVDINGHTRVVEKGYQFDFNDNNSDETYNEGGGAGDFVAIGRMDKYPQELRISDNYDQRIPVRLDSDLFDPSVNT